MTIKHNLDQPNTKAALGSEYLQLFLQLSPQNHISLHVAGDCLNLSLQLPAISSDDIAQFAVQLFKLADDKRKLEDIASQQPKLKGNCPPAFLKALQEQTLKSSATPQQLCVNYPQSHL